MLRSNIYTVDPHDEIDCSRWYVMMDIIRLWLDVRYTDALNNRSEESGVYEDRNLRLR